MFKTKNSKQGGFTLLELLVVIGIIGRLASILVINLTGTRKRASELGTSYMPRTRGSVPNWDIPNSAITMPE